MKSLGTALILMAVAGCGTDSRTPAQKPEPAGGSFQEYSFANSEAAGFKPQRALVRSVDGEVQYFSGEAWKQLRPNQILTNGARIRTGRGASAYLSVNANISAMKLVEDSDLDLTEMMLGRDGAATQTALELRKGAVLGVVKTLPSGSSFQVRAGGVLLKIHGTEFQMRSDGWVGLGSGVATVTSGGKAWQLQTGMYFDPKKNEVGILPPFRTGPPGDPLYLEPDRVQPPRPFRPWQGSSSLPPFQNGPAWVLRQELVAVRAWEPAEEICLSFGRIVV
jgi:hypothetical protein